jgi:hypothetical protein
MTKDGSLVRIPGIMDIDEILSNRRLSCLGSKRSEKMEL